MNGLRLNDKGVIVFVTPPFSAATWFEVAPQQASSLLGIPQPILNDAMWYHVPLYDFSLKDHGTKGIQKIFQKCHELTVSELVEMFRTYQGTPNNGEWLDELALKKKNLVKLELGLPLTESISEGQDYKIWQLKGSPWQLIMSGMEEDQQLNPLFFELVEVISGYTAAFKRMLEREKEALKALNCNK